jgi:hypothetical protein
VCNGKIEVGGNLLLMLFMNPDANVEDKGKTGFWAFQTMIYMYS